MLGYFYDVTIRNVSGWAGTDDCNSVELIVAVNGEVVGHVRPSLHRPDLSFLPRQDLGFICDTDRLLKSGDVVTVTDSQGAHLNGSPLMLAQVGGTREEKALALIKREMKILEIGPSFSPLAPRSQGWQSFSLDHATQEELRHKYKGLQAIERIEPVDFVWHSGSIDTAVPKELHGTFDAIVASHVLEHFPDPIDFFLSGAKLLSERGLISLIVPDKRVMYDFFKSTTMTSDYLSLHNSNRSRHSKKTAFDNIAYSVGERQEIAWSPRLMSAFSFVAGPNSLSQALETFNGTNDSETGHYIDYHNTVYTPASFELIMLELGQLGVIPFRIEQSFAPRFCEFYASLRKGLVARLAPDDLNAERLRLMKTAVRELGEQANWIYDEL